MRKIIIFTFLIILSVTELHAQDYFGKRNKATTRKGVEANMPKLAEGEIYWAVDSEVLFIGQDDGTTKTFYADQPSMKVVNTDTSASTILLDCKRKDKFFVPFLANVDLDFSNLAEGKWVTVIVDNSQPGTGQPTFSNVDFPIDQPLMGDGSVTVYSFIKLNGIIRGAGRDNYPSH